MRIGIIGSMQYPYGIGVCSRTRPEDDLLNPVPDIPYYRTEIEAMQPVVLNGDVTKIKV